MEASKFFSDNKTQIDYILVYKKTKLDTEKKIKLETYLKNLLDIGFKAEIQQFSVNEDIYFVKLHVPIDVVFHYASLCNVDLVCRNDYRPLNEPPTDFMATPLTKPNPQDDVYKRAPESVASQKPTTVTSAEKIMVMNRIMERVKFGDDIGQFSLNNLVEDEVIDDTFPLHDGPFEWTESGNLNDRQLLAKYWANFGCFYKEQPLNLIEKYYGTEYAFYFAWFGFFTKMLIPLGIMSLLCFLYGVITMKTDLNPKSKEICNSNLTMCARCHYSACKFEELSHACGAADMTYIFDNPATFLLAVITSFWSTIFMELWQRNEARLQLQWRVENVYCDDYERPKYIQKSKSTRYNKIKDYNEPYVSSKRQFGRFILSLIAIILLFSIIVFGTIAIMVYRIAVMIALMAVSDEKTMKYIPTVASVSGGFLSACLIVLCFALIPKIAMKLTDLENHRTQHEYDQAFIFKYYILSFTNAYTTVFYISFFKGRFFSHPGELSNWTYLGGIGADICGPVGCVADLSVQLITILIIKLSVKHILQIAVPILRVILKRKKFGMKSVPFYEEEYILNEVTFDSLHEEYLDLVLQYGFIVFFVSTFPIAPALALINNIFEIRTDAIKFVKRSRRPLPVRVSGVGAWFEIMQVVTYLGIIVNGIMIAFTSDFVPRVAHRDQEEYSFVNSSLSVFSLDDFVMQRSDVNQTCYYPGQRHPPDHAEKYNFTPEFWYLLSIRFFVVILIEHIILALNGILAYAINDVPHEVLEQRELDEKKAKKQRQKLN